MPSIMLLRLRQRTVTVTQVWHFQSQSVSTTAPSSKKAKLKKQTQSIPDDAKENQFKKVDNTSVLNAAPQRSVADILATIPSFQDPIDMDYGWIMSPKAPLEVDGESLQNDKQATDPALAHCNKDAYFKFIHELNNKRNIAKRTVAIRSKPKREVVESVIADCEHFGPVKSTDCIVDSRYGEDRCLLLVEFASFSSAINLLKYMRYAQPLSPGSNRILRTNTNAVIPTDSKEQGCSLSLHYTEHHHTMEPPNRMQASTELNQCSNLDEFIEHFSKLYHMDEIQERLNFLTCQIVDDMLCHHYPRCTTLPHGSTVSQLGNKGCDLDLVSHLTGIFQKHNYKNVKMQCLLHGVTPYVSRATKSSYVISKIGVWFRDFMPEYSDIQPIPRARIPIVRFTNLLALNRCDLQVETSNMNKSLMASFMINTMIKIDPRVKLLATAVKRWAQAHMLTAENPGHQMINFSLVHMLIFFMQQQKFIPPAAELYGSSHEDVTARISEMAATNQGDLGALYVEFFKFWSKFDYNQVIDISTAQSYSYEGVIPEFQTPLKIRNTLDQDRNIAFRTSDNYLQSFKQDCVKTHNYLANINLKRFLHLHFKSHV